MGIFKKKSKEEKEFDRIEKINKKMKELGLEGLSLKEKEQANYVYSLEMPLLDSISDFNRKEEDSAKINYLYCLIEQNWILLKKLDNMERIQEKILERLDKE